MLINQLPAKTFFSESVQSLLTRVLLSAVGGHKESICHHPPVHGSKQAGSRWFVFLCSKTEQHRRTSATFKCRRAFFLSFQPVQFAPEAFWQEQPS
jgi:hypothetical protein